MFGISVLSAGLCCGLAVCQEATTAQAEGSQRPTTGQVADPAKASLPALPPGVSPVPLDWTPPALAQLSTVAAVKTSFTLDRSLLGAAAGMVPDSEPETRKAIGELDGVSVHVLRFANAGMEDEEQLEALREAYHLRGWKHLVTTTEKGGPAHSATTDLWLVLDGVNVRGAVVLNETPKSLTLVTVAGNLSPIDLLHLRGHFGIPRFDGNDFRSAIRR